MPKQPKIPAQNIAPDAGPKGGAGAARIINQKAKAAVDKTHGATNALGHGRSQLIEPFSGIQTLADFTEGLPDFMVGVGTAGMSFTLITDFGTFNLGIGGTSSNPLGYLSAPGFGNLFDAGFRNGPGSISFGPGISPPNNMKGTTSSGPSGGVKK